MKVEKMKKNWDDVINNIKAEQLDEAILHLERCLKISIIQGNIFQMINAKGVLNMLKERKRNESKN